MPTPLFVVSAPRSGSTHLVATIASHPDVEMTNESGWVAFLRKADLLATTPALDPIDDGEGFQTFGCVAIKYIPRIRDAFGAAARRFVEEFGQRGRYFGDKLHSHNDLAYAARTFPDAVFVLLVRDVRDLFVSLDAFQRKQPVAWQSASFDQRCSHLERFYRVCADELARRRHHLVRYEDLVAEPAGTIGGVLDFLGLPAAPEVDAYLAEGATRLFESHGTATSPAASIGRWREELDDAERRTLEATFGERMRGWGYEL